MTLTIYGDQKSGNCLKVKWVCERLGLAFRWLDVDIMRSETRTPEFLLLNPAGQVPVVVLADGRTSSDGAGVGGASLKRRRETVAVMAQRITNAM